MFPLLYAMKYPKTGNVIEPIRKCKILTNTRKKIPLISLPKVTKIVDKQSPNFSLFNHTYIASRSNYILLYNLSYLTCFSC